MKEIKSTASEIIRSFSEKNCTLAVAESCTGGLLGAGLTEISGSSSVFMGGIIAYDNSAKANILNIKKETLDEYGAVSAECALEMAVSAKLLFNTSAAVSITGIAGPTGAVQGKPVGTVFIAAVYGDKRVVENYHFQGEREEVRVKSVLSALEQLLKLAKIDE